MFSRNPTLLLSLSLVAAMAVACSDDSPLIPKAEKPSQRVYSAGDTTDALGEKFVPGPEQPLDSTVTREDTSTEVDTLAGQITTSKFVTQQIHFSAKDNPEQFMNFDANAGALWPGNIVMGNTVAAGAPSEFPISRHRRPITVYLDIVSGDSSGVANHFSRTIEDPTGDAVNLAMNSILAGYKGGAPAKFTYKAQSVYSASQMAFQLGLGYSGPVGSVNTHFAVGSDQSKNYYTVRLTQQYYTMTINPIFGLHGAWDSTITAADVRPFAGPDSPVGYIGSITFGRVYLLTYASSESATTLAAAVNAAFNGGVASGNVDAAAEYNRVVKNSSVSITQVGGDAAAGLAAAVHDYDAIQHFLTAGANFSPTSPGAPISYKVRYLSDGTLMKLNSTMDYTVTEKIPVGSALSYTSSDFDLYVDNYSDWGSIVGSRGAVRVRLLEINKQTGETRELWREPCSVNCQQGDGREASGIYWVPWSEDSKWNPVNVGWIAPTFHYENKPGFELAVECSAVNFEEWHNPQIGTDRHIYGYNPSAQTWQALNETGSRTRGVCQAIDPQRYLTVKVNYTFTVNGQAM